MENLSDSFSDLLLELIALSRCSVLAPDTGNWWEKTFLFTMETSLVSQRCGVICGQSPRVSWEVARCTVQVVTTISPDCSKSRADFRLLICPPLSGAKTEQRLNALISSSDAGKESLKFSVAAPLSKQKELLSDLTGNIWGRRRISRGCRFPPC